MVAPKKNPQTYDDLLGGGSLTGSETVRPRARFSGGFSREILPQGNTRGVFSAHPASTPKYRAEPQAGGAAETMARLFVPMPNGPSRWKFIQSIWEREARNLAKNLTTYGDQKPVMGNNGTGLGYVDFLLQNVQESYQEKAQISEVLSDNYVVYYFGSRPPVFQYSGKLLNTYQDDWRSAFTLLYRSVMRGTQLSRRKALISIAYDNVVVTGTMMSMSQGLNAEIEMAADFNFTLLVKRYDLFRLPGTTPTPPSGGVEYFNRINPSELASTLQLGRIPKNIREVGSPQYVTSQSKNEQESGDRGTNGAKRNTITREPPGVAQQQSNLYNPPVDQAAIDAALEYGESREIPPDEEEVAGGFTPAP